MSKSPELNPTSLTLRHPVEVDGAPVTSLTIRPPRAGDSVDAQRQAPHESEVEIYLFASLCETKPDTIRALHMADYVRLQNAYQDFLGGVRLKT